ncbi:MAG: GDSL-type esterase/lipase family protein [Acidobacteriota bacterium]
MKRQEKLKALRIHANIFLRAVNRASRLCQRKGTSTQRRRDAEQTQRISAQPLRLCISAVFIPLAVHRFEATHETRRYQKILWMLRACLISTLILLFAAPAHAGNLVSNRPIENPEAMAAFYSSLRLTDAGQAITRIIHYGDSHVASDLMTGEMRQRFHSGFGSAGTGFALAARPWKWYSPVGGSITTSAGWRADGLSQSTDARLGLAGVCASADRTAEWIQLTARGRYFDIYLLKQPGGGSIDVLLDGALIHQNARLALDHYKPFYLEVEAESDGAHTIEIKISASGRVRLFGIAAESDSAGVGYDALGINGARAYLPLAWDWRVLADNLARRDPTLIIIAYGSNEAGDVDFNPSDYAKRFSEMLRRFQHATPDASILVISPPDRAVKTGSRWHSIKRMPSLVEVQRRAAREQGAAFWNLFEAMGGSDSIDRWARAGFAASDRVHLTRAGYRMIAEALYAELMRGYLWTLIGQAAAQTRDHRLDGGTHGPYQSSRRRLF